MEDDRSQMQVLNLLTLESEPLGRFLGDQTLSEPTERGIALVLQDRGVAQPFVVVVEAPPCVVWLDLAAVTAPASPHTSSSSSSSSSRESSSDTDSTRTSATDTVLLVHRKNAVATAHRMLEHALQQLASRLRAHEASPDTSSTTSSDSDGWGSGRERTPLSQQLADAEAAVARARTQLEHDFTLSLPGGAGAGRRLLARAEDAWRATLRGLAGLLARARAAQARRDDAPSPSPTLALASASAVAAAPSELLASALAPFPHVSAAEADALAQENARLRADLARATAERDETRDECRRLQRALVEVQQQQQQRQREQQQREQREQQQQQQQQRKREWGARARTDEVSVDRTYLEFMGSCCIVFDAVLVRGQRVFRAHGVAVPTFLERDQAHAIDPAYRGAILCRALRATSRIHVESDVCAPHAFGFCDEENDMLLLLLDRRTASSTGCTVETRTRSSPASTSGR